jgi:ATP-dependent Clp endopeptidase proteolytic subunit ClpP
MDWMKIKNQTDESADLYFYGDIVSSWWGAWDDADQYPEAIRDFLNGVEGKNLNIYINSGGGSVFAGIAIYNMLKRHQGNKTVYVDGLAASIASVIALAGDKVVIPSNAFMMIHKPWNGMYGNSTDFRKMADDLDAIEQGIMNVYADNLKDGIDIETIRQMVQEETWLNGLEAAKYFNIEVVQENQAVACISDQFKNYHKVPKSLEAPQQQPQNEDNINDLLMELDLI